jgi:hypothetical protein
MSSKKAVLAVVFLLFLASMACNNPITSYFSTRTAVMETATATMWTPTPTNTPTPTITATPTKTKTPTHTPSPTPDNRFYEKGGAIEFSYVSPIGWRKGDITNGLNSWYGKGVTVLSFVMVKSNLDAATTGAAAEDGMKPAFPGYKFIDEGVFSPDSGLDAFWFSFTAPSQGVTLYIKLYIFSGSGYILDGYYIRPDGLYEDQDTLVEDSMMTMRFE